MQELYTARKIVSAKPMTRTDFLKYMRETDSIARNEEGYLVEYLDGGTPNHPAHRGYVSWCPKDVFERQNIFVGGTSELPPHICRLLAEHAALKSDFDKLNAFIKVQYDLRCAELPELMAKSSVKVTDEQLDLLVQQAAIQKALLDILSRRLLISDLGHNVEHIADVTYSLSTGGVFNIAHSMLGESVYEGAILSIDPDVKITRSNGDVVEATVLVTKLARGWSISGNIDEELFDIGIDANRGIAYVTSSFASEGAGLNIADYAITLKIELGTINQLPAMI